MEYNKIEDAIIREIAAQAPEKEIQELTEMQLLLIGGGGADVALQ